MDGFEHIANILKPPPPPPTEEERPPLRRLDIVQTTHLLDILYRMRVCVIYDDYTVFALKMVEAARYYIGNLPGEVWKAASKIQTQVFYALLGDLI